MHYPGHVVSTRRHVLFLCGALLVPVMIAMALAAYGASLFAPNPAVKKRKLPRQADRLKVEFRA